MEQALAAGRDVLFDVDWQGAAALRDDGQGRCGHGLYLCRRTAADLEQRLNERAQDPAEIVRRGCAGRATRSSTGSEYDYVVVNHDIDQSVAAVRAILAAERLRRARLTGLKDFVQNLLAEL